MRLLLVSAIILISSCIPKPRLRRSDQGLVPVILDGGSIGSWVLDCDGHNGAPQVNHGYFYDGVSDLGAFMIQAWVMPRDSGSRYFLSSGYGGAHEVLAGFVETSDNKMLFYGQTWNTSGAVVIYGNTSVDQGTWHHYAWGWDGTLIRVYLDGVPDGTLSMTGPRVSISRNPGGGGELMVCGSTHSNFDGRIAELEIWEGYFPMIDYPTSTFLPKKRFMPQSDDGLVSHPSSFLAVYTSPADVIPDLSPAGFNGKLHAGVPFAAVNQEDRGSFFTPVESGVRPTWVIDYNAPTAN